MSYRYGGKTRPGTDVAGWLNGKDAPWWTNFNLSFVSSIGAVTVTADATPHVKGAWTELVASTAAVSDYQIFVVNIPLPASTNTASLIDIAVGASGSEIPIVENIAVGSNGNIPIAMVARIPAGSRLSARNQSAVISKTATIATTLFDTGNFSVAPAFLDVLGTSTANSQGTNVTDAYSEIVASLSISYAGFIVVPSLNTTGIANSNQTVTMAIGSAGNEVDVMFFDIQTNTQEQVLPVGTGSFRFMKGPFTAGTRISAKTSLTTGNGGKSLCLIGIPFI
jgi:hypothetical protein